MQILSKTRRSGKDETERRCFLLPTAYWSVRLGLTESFHVLLMVKKGKDQIFWVNVESQIKMLELLIEYSV